MYFDSHCHLTDPRFDGERAAVWERARAAGVDELVTVASDAADSGAALELALTHDGIRSTAGIHPHEAVHADAAALARVADLLERPEVVAVGETGLDYHYDHSPQDAQRRAFAHHLELSLRTGKPVVVHSRDADQDTAAMIGEAGREVRGVLHCFAGGASLLEAALLLDWYVSFSGMVTFRSWEGEALLRRVPADRLLIETDSPYLAPVPHRGKRNEPAYVTRVAATVGELLGESATVVGRRTAENARRFYGLEDPS